MSIFNRNMTGLVGFLLVWLVAGSCKKSFLEINPAGKVIAQATADYDLLMNGSSTYPFAPLPQLVMSDDLAASATDFASLGAGVLTLADQKAFMWNDDLYLPPDKTSELTAPMSQLYVFNKIINEVMSSVGGSNSQKKSLQAEALTARAFMNFMLVNYYGKPYTASSSSTDLGIPVIKTADVTQTVFSRATVQAVYDQLIGDLTQAIPALPATVTSRARVSRSAAEAILGKVYVYMGQFDKALPLLQAAIADLAGAGTPVGLYDFNVELAAGGAFYPPNPIVGPPRTNPNIDKEILYLRRGFNLYNYLLSGIIMSPQAAALYAPDDLRLQFFTPYSFGLAAVYPLGMLRAYGKGYTNVGVNVPDIYLLLAECKSRTGDLSGAAADMASFRSNRMPAADAPVPAGIAANQVSLTKFILEERIREFALSGERWWDMRRLSVDPVYHTTVGTTHTVYDYSGNVTATYTLKPQRLTFRFPQYVMAANPGLIQNP